jgi:hypothetical protein
VFLLACLHLRLAEVEARPFCLPVGSCGVASGCVSALQALSGRQCGVLEV